MTHDFTTLAGIMATAEELNEAAKKVDLEYWFEIDFHFMTISTRITKGIGPGCKDKWPGCVMAKLSAGMIGQKMEEAAEFLAKYQEDQAATLEKEVADLAEQLKTKRAALRKAKKKAEFDTYNARVKELKAEAGRKCLAPEARREAIKR